MDQRVIDLYDHFTHGVIDRRAFLDRLTAIAGSAAAAVALLPLLQNDYARAAIVAADDARLAIDTVSYDAGGTKISGYLARLKDKGKRPAVLVIHENRGLNPHIQDIARRLALEGFLAFAVDLLSPLGGTPADEDKARDMIGTLKPEETARHAAAAVPFLEHHLESSGNVGAVGFCWGGGGINRVAVLAPDLKAAVAYYGLQVPADQIPAIRAPLLAALCRARPARECGDCCLRSCAQGRPQALHDLHLPERQSRLQQRYRQKLRQAGGGSRVEPHHRLPQGKPWRAAKGRVTNGRPAR